MDSIISDLKKAETLLTGTDPLNFEFPVSDYEEEDREVTVFWYIVINA